MPSASTQRRTETPRKSFSGPGDRFHQGQRGVYSLRKNTSPPVLLLVRTHGQERARGADCRTIADFWIFRAGNQFFTVISVPLWGPPRPRLQYDECKILGSYIPCHPFSIGLIPVDHPIAVGMKRTIDITTSIRSPDRGTLILTGRFIHTSTSV